MNRPATVIDRIDENLYRISTALSPEALPGAFTFNQYLLVDEAPVLVHTGPGALFGDIRQAIETVLPLGELRYIAFRHSTIPTVIRWRGIADWQAFAQLT